MKARTGALVLAALAVAYLVLVGRLGLVLLTDGRPAFGVLGVGVLLLPAVGVWVVLAEVRFGRATQQLGERLGAEGGLPADDLPRRPSGRVDRGAATAAFEARRAEVEAHPDDWRPWFRLGIAYDDAGDRRRARSAMRRAVALAAGRTPPPL